MSTATPTTIDAKGFAAATSMDPLHLVAAVAYLKKRIPVVPDLGVICGSGLGELYLGVSDRVSIPYKDIPGFPVSTVSGHSSELVWGKLGGKEVILFRGRFHFYEGYSPAQTAMPIRVLSAMGAKAVVITNASGGVNPAYNIGDFMIIKDHISFPCLSGSNPLMGHNDPRFGPRFPAVAPIMDKNLQRLLADTAADLGLDNIRFGTYCGVSGPSYETPHEIGAIRVLGGDAVGMSTVPELVVAAHCGLPVVGIALVSNRCKGPDDDHIDPTHAEVLESVSARTEDMQRLITTFVSKLSLSSYDRPAAYHNFKEHASSTLTLTTTAKEVGTWSLSVLPAIIAGAFAGAVAATVILAARKRS